MCSLPCRYGDLFQWTDNTVSYFPWVKQHKRRPACGYLQPSRLGYIALDRCRTRDNHGYFFFFFFFSFIRWTLQSLR